MKATLIVIENDADHHQALRLMEKMMVAGGPEDRARMTAQARLIEAYERGRWPVRTPSVADFLNYLMDQHGMTRGDLVPLLGTPSRVSEVLNGKRDLSMTMVRKLRDRFHVPADVLIPPGKVAEAAE